MSLHPRKNLKFFSIVALLVILVFISSRGANNPAKGGILWIASPFMKTFRVFSGGVAGFFQFIGSIGELKNENENLVKENLALTAKIAELKDVGKENGLLRQELGLLPKNKYDLAACFIIAQDSLGTGNSKLLIDKGSADGIKEEMPVIVSGGILVGKVHEVFHSTASVELIIDQDSAINAEILDSGVKGIVKGNYGLGAMIDMVSQTEILKEGDTVISSGLGGGLPRGFYIGKISQIGQSSDNLFQQASIISSVDLASLRVVFVVKN